MHRYRVIYRRNFYGNRYDWIVFDLSTRQSTRCRNRRTGLMLAALLNRHPLANFCFPWARDHVLTHREFNAAYLYARQKPSP